MYHDDEDLDPQSIPSVTTSSQSESDSEAEYIEEHSSRGQSGSGQLDQPGESATVPVPTAQLEPTEEARLGQPAPQAEQSGSAGPTSGSAGPTSEQPDLISFDSDVIVEQETILESEVVSSEERGVSPPLQELSQGNAMAASATSIGDGEADSDGMFTRDELKEAQQKDEEIWISIEHCKKGVPPDRTEIREVPEEAKQLLLQFESLLVRNDILYRRFQHPDGTTNYLQLVLPVSLCREYIEHIHSDLGHFGQTKTCDAIARRAYFPGWHPYTKLVVRNCTTCNKSQRSLQTP